jgi:hypothetical protein
VVRIALEEGQATVGDCRGEDLVLEAGESVELKWDTAEPCAAR